MQPALTVPDSPARRDFIKASAAFTALTIGGIALARSTPPRAARAIRQSQYPRDCPTRRCRQPSLTRFRRLRDLRSYLV